MLDYKGEKLQTFLQKSKISVKKIADILEINRQTVYKYFKSKQLSREVVAKITTKLNLTEKQIWGNDDEIIKQPRLEAQLLYIAADPRDHNNDGSKFEDLQNGFIRMRIKIVPNKAYAGYLRGFQDREYYEDFQTTSIEVQKEFRGNYLAFEVKGDSMITMDPNQFEDMALPGWKAIARELPRHHWQYKLHTHKVDTWVIVHRTEGILIKKIINHDVENGRITIHSLNPHYPDEVLELDDIAQIFSVVKYIIDK